MTAPGRFGQPHTDASGKAFEKKPVPAPAPAAQTDEARLNAVAAKQEGKYRKMAGAPPLPPKK